MRFHDIKVENIRNCTPNHVNQPTKHGNFVPIKNQSPVCLQQKAAARYGHLWSSFSKRARWSCAKKCSWRKISVTWAGPLQDVMQEDSAKRGDHFFLAQIVVLVGFVVGFLNVEFWDCIWNLWVLVGFGLLNQLNFISHVFSPWIHKHLNNFVVWDQILKLSTIPIFESIWGAFSNSFHSRPPPSRHGEQPPPREAVQQFHPIFPRFASVRMHFSTSEGGMGGFCFIGSLKHRLKWKSISQRQKTDKMTPEKDGGDLMSDAAKWEDNILTRESLTFSGTPLDPSQDENRGKVKV